MRGSELLQLLGPCRSAVLLVERNEFVLVAGGGPTLSGELATAQQPEPCAPSQSRRWLHAGWTFEPRFSPEGQAVPSSREREPVVTHGWLLDPFAYPRIAPLVFTPCPSLVCSCCALFCVFIRASNRDVGLLRSQLRVWIDQSPVPSVHAARWAINSCLESRCSGAAIKALETEVFAWLLWS